QTITTKDGKSFERKAKVLNYDTMVSFKMAGKQKDIAKDMAKVLNISFNEFIRQGIDLMIKKGAKVSSTQTKTD
ncbi:MAG TPA: hypothetical protein VFC60_00060, partial [Tissierellaceae bacterium]|nr:hypothetical protein [Tissierellaceae bacterium]